MATTSAAAIDDLSGHSFQRPSVLKSASLPVETADSLLGFR